ncbi:hypothetical protein TI04_07115, partial [Achromatium sp. WMS2]
TANQLLDEIFEPFANPVYPNNLLHIVAINSGKLLEWISTQPTTNYLAQQLRNILLGTSIHLDPRLRFIDLNQRSLVGGVDLATKTTTTEFINTLIDKLLGTTTNYWLSCPNCPAQTRCSAWESVCTLRHPELGPVVRNHLITALQTCHQRGEIHITIRDLRATLSYIFFGTEYCTDLHAKPDFYPQRYFERAFNASSQHRQGELLTELAKLDPHLETTPILDRQLLKVSKTTPLAPNTPRLAWMRRRQYFIATETNEQIYLAGGKYTQLFRDFPLLNVTEQHKICRNICIGIARLEDLPIIVFQEHNLALGVPLKLTPRTKIESILWYVKPWANFSLQCSSLNVVPGLETLATQLQLSYQYANGTQEHLTMSLELFSLLLELKDGLQLSGGQEEKFVNLKIFTQRLVLEDARELYGYHPASGNQIFRLWVQETPAGQTITREIVNGHGYK